MFHCDLKPDNIFIKNGQIKIGDFGLSITTKMMLKRLQKESKKLKKSNADDSSSYGSLQYMASDLKWNSVKSDMYSFGVILFEMCHPPFLNDTERMNAMKPFLDGTVFSQRLNTQHTEYIKVDFQRSFHSIICSHQKLYLLFIGCSRYVIY